MSTTDVNQVAAPEVSGAEARTFALLVLATLIAGVLIPAGGLVIAFVAWAATSVRRSKPQTIALFVIGGVLALAVILTLAGGFIPPFSIVSPGQPAGN